MALDEKLLEILACPQCHSRVRLDEKTGGLICGKCQLLYKIENDIPVMLIEKGKKLSTN